jgi:hypothetical protein
MESARHVVRVLVLLLLAVIGVAVLRSALKPASYGMHGNYRFDNVAEQMQRRPPLHGGAASCAECHAERAKVVTAGAHTHVSCEICHGPLGVHVKDGAKTAAMPVDRSFTLCARCHRKIDGRPAKFPMVVLDRHVEEQGAGPVAGKICLDCHDPHTPKL